MINQPGVNRKNKIDVFINDQTNPLFQYFLINEIKTDITLTAPVSINDTVVNVSSGHEFIVGEVLTIFENNRYIQMNVVSVATDAIAIAYPIANAFTVAGAVVVRDNLTGLTSLTVSLVGSYTDEI